MAQPKIDFLFFDAGGGHRAAATALDAILRQQQRPWDVRLVDVNDVLVATDVFKKVTGYGLEDIYNLILERGWTLGSTELLPVMHWFIRMFHGHQVNLMEAHWRKDTPDMVVSLIPNFNRALFEALRRVSPSVPYVGILTDMADFPPNFWIERGQDQYFICGTQRAVDQCRELGHPAAKVFRTSGMILRPSFYDVPPIDREAERRKVGLEPGVATGVILFGGHAPPYVAKIVEALEPLAGRLQLIVLCGHNKGLAEKLRARRSPLKMHVEGFTREVPRYMQMADFMIGKPGPGSVSEALQMGLAVIVEKNAWTMPQERFNADWLAENRVGVVLPSFRGIRGAVEGLLSGDRLGEFRRRAAGLNNRAIFEIPDILQKLLET